MNLLSAHVWHAHCFIEPAYRWPERSLMMYGMPEFSAAFDLVAAMSLTAGTFAAIVAGYFAGAALHRVSRRPAPQAIPARA
jgi:hypothetical protein